MTDGPNESELAAYVDGQLDVEGRFAVEDHLRRHPDLAARVMGDLGARSALQLLAQDKRAMPAAVTALGRDLAEPVRRWGRWMSVGGTSVAAAVVALLFVATQGPPAYVDYAISSHRIAMMRAGLDSQAETPHYDAREIASTTNIAIPSVPKSWKITDVQLFPTERGPALLVAVRTRRAIRCRSLRCTSVPGRPNAPTRCVKARNRWPIGAAATCPMRWSATPGRARSTRRRRSWRAVGPDGDASGATCVRKIDNSRSF